MEGAGAGVNITPVAFLIVQNDTVKLLEANHVSVLDKLVEYVPDVIDKVNKLFNKKMDENQNDDSTNFEEDDEIEYYSENDTNVNKDKSQDNNFITEDDIKNKVDEIKIEEDE